MIKSTLFLGMVAALVSSPAFGWSGSASLEQTTYSCIGIDGIPIPAGTSLETLCCSNGQLKPNPPGDCRAGFSNIGPDATGSAFNYTNLALQTLFTAQNLNGLSNGNGSGNSNTNSSSGTSRADTSAMVSGGSASGSGDSGRSGSGSGAGNGNASGSSGSGSGGSGGGSSGSLGLSGSSSGDGKGAKPADDPNSNLKNNTLAYVSNGEKGAGTGSGGNGLFGSGSGGSGAVGLGDSEKGLTLGDGSSDGMNGANAENEDAGASTSDPTDYFNRIDRSASIFKIVSQRYLKKKSLWQAKKE